jgi:hypothetical protein
MYSSSTQPFSDNPRSHKRPTFFPRHSRASHKCYSLLTRSPCHKDSARAAKPTKKQTHEACRSKPASSSARHLSTKRADSRSRPHESNNPTKKSNLETGLATAIHQGNLHPKLSAASTPIPIQAKCAGKLESLRGSLRRDLRRWVRSRKLEG